ncbi:hypothetical protein ROZALSC1DRAFT_21422 [Rozella allomycis CSF55]|uniref:G-protein coupled receptors family 2 profile 2 domain-containing protein n=1 Tax=Rozella allomycis (strain CSF55) TaxID=988480 RepID=A0A4P9YP18_ROZAC|nr:hypothetical protein ROZALSC1DRAFT_21422 [Rozella allomycis CSF55]
MFMAISILISTFVNSFGTSTMYLGKASLACRIQTILFQWMGLSSCFWILAFHVNIFLTVYTKLSVRAIRYLEILYHLLCWGGPLLLALISNNMDKIETGIWCELNTTEKFGAFYAPIWTIFIIQVVVYISVGRRLWWSPLNIRYTWSRPSIDVNESKSLLGNSNTRKIKILDTSFTMISAYFLVWIIPTVYDISFILSNSKSGKIFRDQNRILYGLKAISILLGGGILCLVYLRWAVRSVEQFKSYLFRQKFGPLFEKSPAYVMRESVPILKQNTLTSEKRPSEAHSLMPGMQQNHIVVALYSYEAERNDELNLLENDRIVLVETPRGGWFKGYKESDPNQLGWFPSHFVWPVGTNSARPSFFIGTDTTESTEDDERTTYQNKLSSFSENYKHYY